MCGYKFPGESFGKIKGTPLKIFKNPEIVIQVEYQNLYPPHRKKITDLKISAQIPERIVLF